MHILTDAGFTADEADGIVQSLVHGIDLHQDHEEPGFVNIDELPVEKREALERFNKAVAADA